MEQCVVRCAEKLRAWMTGFGLLGLARLLKGVACLVLVPLINLNLAQSRH